MKEQSRALLAKASENLAAAQDLMDKGHAEVAVSRAYYAMFYAAEAALLEEDLEFSSHGAVHGAFGERLAKSGRLEPKLHRYLLDAYRARQSADYDAPADISAEDARVVVNRAQEFISAIKRYLGSAD
jgi:uncharacterized protein (UPF0332 family)